MRPYLTKTLQALQDYAKKKPDGSWRYRLTEIAQRHHIQVSSLSRAAHKHGLTRYREQG